MSKIAVIVAGVHRSGTSALTRALSRTGLELPKTLAGGSEENLTGYWESVKLMKANDRILGSLGGCWSSCAPVSHSRFKWDEKAVKLIEETVGEEFDGERILIKDPRISQMLPLYYRALEGMGFEVRVVLATRDPAEVVESLMKRNLTRQRSREIWLRGMFASEGASWGRRRVWSSYQKLLEDPVEEVKWVLSGLGLVWEEGIREALTGVVDRKLQNNKGGESSPLEACVWGAARMGRQGQDRAAHLNMTTLRREAGANFWLD